MRQCPGPDFSSFRAKRRETFFQAPQYAAAPLASATSNSEREAWLAPGLTEAPFFGWIAIQGKGVRDHGGPSKYPADLRERAVRLTRESGRPIAHVARDLAIHRETLRLWVRRDEADQGTCSDRLATAEREELAALRREVRELRRANEILKAASVFFARELGSPRPR